ARTVPLPHGRSSGAVPLPPQSTPGASLKPPSRRAAVLRYDSLAFPSKAPARTPMSTAPFHAHILELIRRTSAFLPPDVSRVIEMRRALETAGSKADLALSLVAQNIALAKGLSAPICQDTGTIT